MNKRVSLAPTVALLAALFLIAFEAFLFLGGSFGEYETRFARPTDLPEPLDLNGFPYSLLAAAAILIWIYAAYVAGASIDREQFNVRKLYVAMALSVLSSVLLLAGLMLVIAIEMQSDDVVRYSTDGGAYVLIGLPLAAAASLWFAASRYPKA